MVDPKRYPSLSVRLSSEAIKRLDALKRNPRIRALPAFEDLIALPSRSDVARVCILRGLDRLEAETKRTAPPPPIADAAALPRPEQPAPQRKKVTRKKKADLVSREGPAELADPDVQRLIDDGVPQDEALELLRKRRKREGR